ncbi:Carbohydrate-binding, CenC-like protein [Cynara cardunculus var. scolymus]|uniref:Carbohydrate-binding, CenC-like protein n=1 Tax=Cynara cardunculus var. scolymus TaxID=59895 RepID=A0A118K0V1_CYNCS|nr:Carbohydrate-binding, CenC-like protein [Cynara cardunculus var. scolymus]
MKIEAWCYSLFNFFMIVSGFVVNAYAVPYDYGYTAECLKNPNKPQYDGGIVVNPELNDGDKGWTSFGNAKLQIRRSETGNGFAVAYRRNQSFDSISQEFFLDHQKLYTFSAWVQISHGDATVVATFKTPTGYYNAAATKAISGCWSMLKGGLTVNDSGTAHLYFQSENPSIDIWIDSVSLQPFTQEEWKSHHSQSIEKVRKSKVRIQAVDGKGKPLANRTLTIQQKFAKFPFGCAINKNILNNQAYQNWFTSRFKYTTFENEMKWYANEPIQNCEDYTAADAMLQFTKSHGVSVRGHNVFWDDPKYQPSWVPNLQPSQLAAAANKRINSVMRRYSGQVISWDVVNENLHFNFFESKLGKTASSKFYTQARALDRNAALFLNDYNTIESPGDTKSSPDSYLSKIRETRSGGYRGTLSIGLEAFAAAKPVLCFIYFTNIPYMRSAIDKVASSKLPIWITEVDVGAGSNQAAILDQVLREAHAHPAVNGIILWSAWSPNGCYRMCLTDSSFRNLPTGDVVDKIIREFFGAVVTATTDANGFYDTSLLHGDYQLSFAEFDRYQPHEKDSNSTWISHNFKVEASDDMLHIKILA